MSTTITATTTTTNTTTSIQDPTEVDLGISVYLTQKDGFSAVLKARYSDFLVHEVGMDGSVARLDCMEAKLLESQKLESPKKQDDVNNLAAAAAVVVVEDDDEEATSTSLPTTMTTTNKKQKIDEQVAVVEKEKTAENVVHFPSLDWESLQNELQELVGVDAAKSTLTFVQKSSSSSSSEKGGEEEEFTVLPANSKDERRKLHEWIRLRLEPVARTDTIDGCVRIWHKRYEHKMSNYKSFVRNNHHHHDSPSKKFNSSSNNKQQSYLQFVLYKENMDTGSAVHYLQQQLQQTSSGGGHQRGKRPHQNRNQQKVRLGYAGMKDKRGITSQFVTVSLDGYGGGGSRRDNGKDGAAVPKIVHDMCRRWNNQNNKNNNNNSGASGGGHTQTRGVGVMRVGNFCLVPQFLQLGRLQGNRFDIVLRNVQDDISVVEEAAQEFRKSGFINFFGVQRFGKYHDTHLVGMAVLRGDYEGAIDIILSPKADEPEPIHQARMEWQKRFEHAEDRADAERQCAKRVMRSFGRFMNTELAVLQSLVRHPLDYKQAFACITKTMRMMFLHALQSFLWNHAASHRIENMGHSPLQGDLVYVDNSRESVESKNVRIVTVKDVETDRYTIEDVVLPLIGTTTVDPENECSAVFDTILTRHGLSREMFAKLNDRDLDVTGDYRKLICHPKDVDFDVLHYSDPLQPLVQTDLMRLQEISVETEKQGSKPSLHAIRIGFTLPSSSYATIALRELMKKPTSSDYQSELKLGKEQEQARTQEDQEG